LANPCGCGYPCRVASHGSFHFACSQASNKTMFDYHKEFATMAAVCDVCAKGPGFGKSVSHSHRRTNRRWNPNIQPVRAQVAPGNTKKLNVCTSCLKAGKVVRG